MLILYCNSKILNICCCPKIQEMWWTEKYYTSKVVSTHPLDQLFQLVHLQDVQVANSLRQISSQAVTTWSVLDELQLLKFWLLSGTFAFHLAHLICSQVTVTCDSEMYLLSAFCFYWWLGCSQQNPQVRWLMRLIWWWCLCCYQPSAKLAVIVSWGIICHHLVAQWTNLSRQLLRCGFWCA